jgi:methionyl-tRNA formyltransferase
MATFRIGIAGSTQYTRMCVQHLLDSPNQEFDIAWILTPTPKAIGRKQIVTKNPLYLFAEDHQFPLILLGKKIDESIRTHILAFQEQQPIDFLLVVDFGYLVPSWLLQLPRIAPLNIHPSLLPRWRGSSPGQFVLLYGEKNSAVTLMTMSQGLDTGDCIFQAGFAVGSNWTQTEYYDHSFSLICQHLAEKILAFGSEKLQPTPQPINSPTRLAGKLSKEDSFISWETLTQAMGMLPEQTPTHPSSSLLMSVHDALNSWPQVIANASRAFSPWPLLWTIIPTSKGEKRMQILRAQVDEQTQMLRLERVKVEGEQETTWEKAYFSLRK